MLHLLHLLQSYKIVMRFELEKSSKKYNCPSCSNKRFVRYVNQQTNEHISFDVGRCDRESSCGYHFTPKMYFAENSEHRINTVNKRTARQGFIIKKRLTSYPSHRKYAKKP